MVICLTALILKLSICKNIKNKIAILEISV
jgi:hypothetical protein